MPSIVKDCEVQRRRRPAPKALVLPQLIRRAAEEVPRDSIRNGTKGADYPDDAKTPGIFQSAV